ncbi:MAG TPA: hypothetical protein VEN30_17190 [Paraburkholderia sp.]|nr:hypothetical protein [Paraburkholderia sp.]
MFLPVFFIHSPENGGSTTSGFFDLNKSKDRFANFEWDPQRPEGRRAKLLATSSGGSHQSGGNHSSLKSAVNYRAILPFYSRTNMISGSQKNMGRLSRATKVNSVQDNSFDSELFRHANRKIERHVIESGRVFSKAPQFVQVVRAEINRLENPHVHSSAVFGVGGRGRANLAPTMALCLSPGGA